MWVVDRFWNDGIAVEQVTVDDAVCDDVFRKDPEVSDTQGEETKD